MTTPTSEIARLALYNTSASNVPYTFVNTDGYGYVTTLVSCLSDTSIVANWIAGLTNTLVVSNDSSVSDIVSLTQSQYDALGTPNATTLYIIKAV